MSSSSFVIAISGPSGCGKTSLVKAVAERLGDAAMLFFDDFPADPPPDGEVWATRRDADYSLWETPEFSEALAALKSGNHRPQLASSMTEGPRRAEPSTC